MQPLNHQKLASHRQKLNTNTDKGLQCIGPLIEILFLFWEIGSSTIGGCTEFDYWRVHLKISKAANTVTSEGGPSINQAMTKTCESQKNDERYCSWLVNNNITCKICVILCMYILSDLTYSGNCVVNEWKKQNNCKKWREASFYLFDHATSDESMHHMSNFSRCLQIIWLLKFKLV